MEGRAATENPRQCLDTDRYDASPQQERLWSLLQSDQGMAYRSQQSVMIEGSLDTRRLEDALLAVANRHEILRTTFQYLSADDRLVQVVHQVCRPAIEQLSLTECPSQDQQAEVSRLFEEMKRLPFDFEKGPLLQMWLLKLSSSKHLLLASIAALCGDSATLSQLFIELAEAYTERVPADGDSQEPFQYADFAQWQREALESGETEAGRRYWRRNDLSLPLIIDLPYQLSRNASAGFEPAMITCEFDRAWAARLAALSQLYEVPQSVILLTAWIVLLWRMSGRRQSIIGVHSDGRKYEELHKALGLYARYLPLACDLESHSRFVDVLRSVCLSVEENNRWQESFTWEQLSRSQSDEREAPYYSALFEVAGQPAKDRHIKTAFPAVNRYECIERYEVKLACIENADGPELELHFDSSRFHAEGIQRLAEGLRILLEAAIADPEARIGELPLLSDSERQYLLSGLNDSHTDDDPAKLVHELFERQAQRMPEAIAVVYQDQKMTYATLNRRANYLAHVLRQRGVGPDGLVALCAERGIDMIVGLLAVLKAGGAYLPLDAGYPKDRLAYMLEDSQAAIVLTQSWLAKDLPPVNVEMIYLDADCQPVDPILAVDVASEVRPENLVYVIYTSGSTGKPKGVGIEHRQLVNYTNGIAKKLKAVEGAGHAALSTLAADLGNTAIFPSLLTGGCLHIISPDAVQDAVVLGEYFENHPIDYLKITPSHLAALQTSRGGERIMPRNTLVLGGEATATAWVRQLREKRPDCKVINHYGPTETTVGALVYEVKCNQGNNEPTASLPLGPPLANATAYVLDDALCAMPVGVTGEIYLGGTGVSRGYLNRPEITASRFLPDPYARQAGSRLYRTGDMARRRADGAVDFLGRLDHQVKIRGFRIELGEIEAVLAEHPAIRKAIVAAREDRPGSKRLVAYLEAKGGKIIQSEEVWSYLRSRLPEYMVPAEYVVLPALPLTANGKVDRRALPAPADSEPDKAAEFVAARTEVEVSLARIWADVLGLERVSIGANFFRLGGDSILSIQIVSRAREAGYYLTARDIFERQTIAELAEVVDRNRPPQAEQGLVSGEASLTPIQQRFFEQDFVDPHHWNQSILLEARQPLRAILLAETLKRLLVHHDSLRLRFVRDETALRQIYSQPGDIVPYAQVDLTALAELHQGLAVERLAAEAQASLNLSQGPLLRMISFHFGGGRPDWLLIIVHHLAIDVVSWHVLLEDLQTSYRQLSLGQPAALPAKTTSYQQWAEHLIEYAQSSEVARQSGYWLNEALNQVAALPLDHRGGNNSEGSVFTVTVALNAQETDTLLHEIPEVYRVQIDDVLLTALAHTLAGWAGSSKLLLEMESHGRHELLPGLDLSRTVGWFTTRFPVLLEVEESAAPAQVLKSIKEQLRQLPQRGLSYGLLRYLSGDAELARRLRTGPQAEVSFNYVGQFDQVFSNTSLFAGMRELCAPNYNLQATRAHLLEVIGRVAQARLQFTFRYSRNLHRRATIERLGEEYLTALRAIINHCLTDTTGGITPSDFPDVALSQNELDSLMAKFG